MNSSWKVTLAFCAVFVAGALCGGSIAWRYARHGRFDEHRPRASMMQRLEQNLSLTPEQKARIEPIVLRGQEEIAKARRDGLQAIRTITDRIHNEIAAELTPEQKAKLDEMRQRFRERVDRARGEFRDREGRDDRDRPPPPPEK